MKKKYLTLAIAVPVVLVLCFLVVEYYSYIFSKTVVGEIVAVDRITQPSTVISGGAAIPTSQVFSFAIAIRVEGGEIATASSEDRQWAVVEKGQCAEAKYYPYPPWMLDKAGTYYGARLMRLYDCNAKPTKE